MASLATPGLHDDYVGALLAGDAVRARHLVERAIARGTSIATVYLEVLAPALDEIGRRWESGEVGIAGEHRATAITAGILGALGPRMRVPPTTGRLAVLACTAGELHELGLRMAGDFLEGAGWEVILLGASVPSAALAGLVADEAPDVVALSTATAGLLEGVRSAIGALGEIDPRPWVVVGGRAWHEPGAPDAAAFGADAAFRDPRALTRALTLRFPAIPDEVL